jgi:hypothetical protein
MTTKGSNDLKSVDLSMTDIGNIDRQIEILMECKPLSETEVKQLCEKVPLPSFNLLSYRPRRSSLMRAMCSKYGLQSPFAVTFTDNSTISKNYSGSVSLQIFTHFDK